MKNLIQNIILLALAALLLGGCASSKSLRITTRPPGAKVNVDGMAMGVSPIVYPYRTQAENIVIEVAKQGYVTETQTVSTRSPEVRAGSTLIVLSEDPMYTETTTSSATNVWLKVQISNRLDEREAWQRIVDSVTSSYDSLEQMDPQSGYLRSSPKQQRWDSPKAGVNILRTQLIATIASTGPLVYKFKIKSELSHGLANDWTEYHRVFYGDAEMIEELTTRLGIK